MKACGGNWPGKNKHECPRNSKEDPRRTELVARRCTTADAVAAWVKEVRDRDGPNGPDGRREKSVRTEPSIPSTKSRNAEIAANAALVLIGVACALLDRQIEAQAAAFENEGGFTERLHRVRSQRKHRG